LLSELFAVLDGLQVALEVDPDPVSHRDAVFHIEKELLHRHASNRFNKRDRQRGGDYKKGPAEIPRFDPNDDDRELHRNGDGCARSPHQSAPSGAGWVAVHFRVPTPTVWVNPMDQV
jgi:hypothetical protein